MPANIPQDNPLVWMDLEMTGLFPDQDTILEIATIITDAQLNIIAEGPVFAIHQPDSVLEAMTEWPKRVHAQSGLTKRVQESQITMEAAERQTLDFISQHLKQGASPLCGNSIHQDRRFLCRYMPTLESYLHYRNLDVSTVKELARRWYPNVFQQVKKQEVHLAVDDIRESIAELLFYREHIFK